MQYIVGIALFVLGLLALLLLPKFANFVYPYASGATVIGIVIILGMLPFTFFKKMRGHIGGITLIISYVIGFGFWSYSALIAYKLWGMTGLTIGMILVGLGVIPIAVIASIWNAEWVILINLTFGAFLTFGSRGLAFYIGSKSI